MLSSLYVKIWRLQTSDSDVKDGPRAEWVNPLIVTVIEKCVFKHVDLQMFDLKLTRYY